MTIGELVQWVTHICWDQAFNSCTSHALLWSHADEVTTITLLTKFHPVQAMVFPAVMYGLESWTIKKSECQRNDSFQLWCWRRLLTFPWTSEIKPVNPEGNQHWIFTGRTDAESEASILWPPDVKSQVIWKDTDAGKDWRREEKGMTEDEMVGWHHQLHGHEFEQALGIVKDREAWRAAAYGVTKNRTRPRDWTTTIHWLLLLLGNNSCLSWCAHWTTIEFCFSLEITKWTCTSASVNTSQTSVRPGTLPRLSVWPLEAEVRALGHCKSLQIMENDTLWSRVTHSLPSNA